MADVAGTIRIGSVSFDPATHRLLQDGRETRLDPKEVDVLLELVAGAPAVVSREHLLARVWAGTSVVDNVLDQVIARLRRALGDDARQPSCIETLPKRGYRLMMPVVDDSGHGGVEARRSAPLPSVTFLPLATIGVEPSLVEYARIASEDISSRLAGSKSIRVIAHESAGRAHPPAKFVAQGTLRRAVNKIRVSVQLVRTDGGDLLWSESFDEPLESAGAGGFARARFVARAIEAIARSANRADLLPTRSEPARRHFFHGLREMDALGYGAGDWFVAADYFERAVDLDPGLTDALRQLAYAYSTRLGERIRAEDALARAHHVLPRLLRIDPDATLPLAVVNHSLDLDYRSALANIEHAQKHGFANVPLVEFHKGLVRYKQGWHDEAIARLQGAIRAGLGANEAIAHYLSADLFWMTGRLDEALASVERGLASAVPHWLRGRILRIRIEHSAGKIEEAMRNLEEAWTLFGASDRASFPSVLACLGQPELARAILRENEVAWLQGRLSTASYSFSGHYYLGELDPAFDWLDRAIENREWWMLPFLRSDALYADIRGDPRFQRALRRLDEIEATPSPTPSVATLALSAGAMSEQVQSAE